MRAWGHVILPSQLLPQCLPHGVSNMDLCHLNVCPPREVACRWNLIMGVSDLGLPPKDEQLSVCNFGTSGLQWPFASMNNRHAMRVFMGICACIVIFSEEKHMLHWWARERALVVKWQWHGNQLPVGDELGKCLAQAVARFAPLTLIMSSSWKCSPSMDSIK